MDETLLNKRAFQAMKVRKAGPVDPRNEPNEVSIASSSFEELFLEHWSSIYRLLVRMIGDPAEAEDLALETFFRLYQRPPKSGKGDNLGGWLYRVAANLGLRSIRSFKRRVQYEMAAGKDVLGDVPEDKPAIILENKEDHRLAQLVLAKMNPRQAELLVMRYSGMAYKDIARVLDLSPTSIGPLLLRAEREFEKAYRALFQEEP
ncbi:MAG: sigma-70 family RNA polymerase sigma factor [Anaerolineales bacterium]|jgi:RNA polymerase sigma factor (sigma-70 family)